MTPPQLLWVFIIIILKSVFFSLLQSGPNVPFGQHTLMVSMQNHLCRSGCFVFLHCDRKQNRKTFYHILLSWTIEHTNSSVGDVCVCVCNHTGRASTCLSFILHKLCSIRVLLNWQVKSTRRPAAVAESDEICLGQHPPLEPPSF